MLRRASVFAVVALGGCGLLGVEDGVRSELERNRRLWEAVGPESYAYSVQRDCYCLGRGPVEVTVTDGSVTGRVWVETGEPVEAELADLFPSVDGIFDYLQDAVDRAAFRVVVRYDPGSGVPLESWVDYQENVADEELGYTVTEPPASDLAP